MTKDGRRDYGTLTPKIIKRLSGGKNSVVIAEELGCEANVVRAIASRYGIKIRPTPGSAHGTQKEEG